MSLIVTTRYEFIMFEDYEVYEIYKHIAKMCSHPDPIHACQMIDNFCRDEMKKIYELREHTQSEPIKDLSHTIYIDDGWDD